MFNMAMDVISEIDLRTEVMKHCLLSFDIALVTAVISRILLGSNACNPY